MRQLPGTAPVLPPPPATLHLVGIGGIGMSGLARIMQAQGYQVTGSDSTKSQATAALIAEGIPVVTGHEQTESAMHADLVVITAAVGAGNPEVEAARAAGVPVIKRAQLLGWLANRRLCIAVAGSHGKSSTSGMIASALVRLGADPAYAVGAILADTNTNAAPGDGPHMVVEADEYDRSFLTLTPDVAVITNVEFDHPDLFETQEVYDHAFLDFIAQIKPGGCLVYAGDDLGALRLLNRAALDPSIRLITFGERAGLDWRLSGTPGRWRLDGPSGASASFRLNVPAHSTTQVRMKPIETS